MSERMSGMRRSLAPTTLLLLAAALGFPGGSDAAEPLEDAIRGTIRITEGGHSATAFVVDLGKAEEETRRYAIVASTRVFRETEESICTLHFRVAHQESGYTRLNLGLRIRKGDEPLWVQHPTADVAAIFVDLPDVADVVPFKVEQIATEKFFDSKRIGVGQEVYIPCFPAKVESNDAGFPVLRKGSIASYPLNRPSVGDGILIDYPYFGGDSGAPVTVIVDDRPIVIGVAVGMLRQVEELESEFEERTTHTPISLAGAARSVLILETLDRLKKSE
ncbi:MAG TPA: hypothetical protein VGN57_04120 [Pirellulaceae bacterium]|jgi:hypothetical protein|nr:hypothetical protein [Pirellulaceae bacterium]